MSAAERVVSLFDVDDVTSFGHVRDFTVTRIGPSDVHEFCRRWHYAEDAGNPLWNYGLWDGITLVGVVSYNLPTMRTCAALFGTERWTWVAHMGRLVCAEDAPRNSESRLIAASMRRLRADRPGTRAVVTYAATGVGHVGYVYQATNALYCGTGGNGACFVDQSGRRRSSYIDGHMMTLARASSLGWRKQPDPPKHRYVYLLGSKTERRDARALLRWPVLPYPKAP